MSIYVITDPIKENENLFKVGRTTKSKKGILTVYTRYLGNPKIIFYKEVPVAHDYKDVERDILKHFEKRRIKNNNGNKSEWIKMPIKTLLPYIENLFYEMEEETDVESNEEPDKESDEETDVETNTEPEESDVETKIVTPIEIKQRIRNINNICSKCNKVFKRNIDLNRHINRKIPCDRKLECNRCFMKFDKKCNLLNHINKKNKCHNRRSEAEIQDSIKTKSLTEAEIQLEIKKLEVELKDKTIKELELQLKLAPKKMPNINIYNNCIKKFNT